MLFVSVAMVLFFSIYIPVYTSTEYSDGILKNRIIAGHSQKDCFIAAVLLMLMIVIPAAMWLRDFRAHHPPHPEESKTAAGVTTCISN